MVLPDHFIVGSRTRACTVKNLVNINLSGYYFSTSLCKLLISDWLTFNFYEFYVYRLLKDKLQLYYVPLFVVFIRFFLLP